MYHNYNYNQDRTGFIGPFLLGGLTGGLIAPLFYNRPNYYYYQPYPYYPYNYYYGPYYR